MMDLIRETNNKIKSDNFQEENASRLTVDICFTLSIEIIEDSSLVPMTKLKFCAMNEWMPVITHVKFRFNHNLLLHITCFTNVI